MFVVTEADAAVIRAALDRDGELSAAVELHRRFSGIVDNAAAREHAQAIAGWKPVTAGRDAAAPKSARRIGRGKSPKQADCSS